MLVDIDDKAIVNAIYSKENWSASDRSTHIKFIQQLDLAVGEVEFTVELITELFKSVVVDMSRSEIDELLANLEKLSSPR